MQLVTLRALCIPRAFQLETLDFINWKAENFSCISWEWESSHATYFQAPKLVKYQGKTIDALHITSRESQDPLNGQPEAPELSSFPTSPSVNVSYCSVCKTWAPVPSPQGVGAGWALTSSQCRHRGRFGLSFGLRVIAESSESGWDFFFP